MWRGGLPQSRAADGSVSFHRTNLPLAWHTDLSMSGPNRSHAQVRAFFQRLHVPTQRVSQIPAQSCSCHQNWMSCCAADSRQLSKQMHADSTFDLVARQFKCLEFVLTACAIYCNWGLRCSKIRLLCDDVQPLKHSLTHTYTQPGGKQWEIGWHKSIMQKSHYKNTIWSTITVHSL